MNKVNVDFGGWIQKGFDLYKNNLVVLIIAHLVAFVLSAFTLGILAGPMFAGLALITLRLVDQQAPKPEIGDVFKGFEYFLQSFLFYLVWGVISMVAISVIGWIPCVGQLASIFVAYALQALLIFSIFLIVEKKMDFWSASMESFNVVKTNFWPFLGLTVVAGIIGSVGLVLCGIGVVLTAPIYGCIVTVAYRESYKQASAETVTVTAEPPPAQPQA